MNSVLTSAVNANDIKWSRETDRYLARILRILAITALCPLVAGVISLNVGNNLISISALKIALLLGCLLPTVFYGNEVSTVRTLRYSV